MVDLGVIKPDEGCDYSQFNIHYSLMISQQSLITNHQSPITSLELPGIKKLRSGKVREVFDLGETLLFVATDRLSAFDVVFSDPIPGKGEVLNQLSAFWFQRFTFVQNHLITAKIEAGG